MAVAAALTTCADDVRDEHPARQPVDLVHLARHTLGNRDLEQEVLRLFLCQSVAFLGRMKRSPDREARACAAHTIKGSARGIGAWQVAEYAEAVERDGDDASLDALEHAIDHANAYISDLLGRG